MDPGIAHFLWLQRVQRVASSLGLTVNNIHAARVELAKVTGGKVVVFMTQNCATVGGVEFYSNSDENALYWATQWYAHCR